MLTTQPEAQEILAYRIVGCRMTAMWKWCHLLEITLACQQRISVGFFYYFEKRRMACDLLSMGMAHL